MTGKNNFAVFSKMHVIFYAYLLNFEFIKFLFHLIVIINQVRMYFRVLLFFQKCVPISFDFVFVYSI